MAMTSSTRHELRSLLSTLLLLGMEETARKLQHIGETFQISHLAAVKLAEDATSTDIVDDQTYALEHYIKTVKSKEYDSEVFSWRSNIFILPSQG
ncbi:Elongator complex protein 1 [Bienertia sinuspersici]